MRQTKLLSHLSRLSLLSVGLLLLSTGCRPQSTAESAPNALPVLGVVLKTMDAEYWMDLRSGIEQAAAEYGVRLLMQWPSDETQSDEQKIMVQDMLAQDIDALLYAPCDSRQTVWLQELANQCNIPVLTVDTGTTDSNFAYIGSDNRAIGHMAYQYLTEILPVGSRAGIIAGDLVQQSISDRVTGMRFYCERDQMLAVAEVIANCKDYGDAYYAARRLIEEQNVSALFCTSAVLGMGAAGACKELDRADIQLICVDTQEDALRSLQLGELDAIITQSGYDIGYQAVCRAVTHPEQVATGEHYFIENTVVTRDNIQTKGTSENGNQN